MGGVHRDTNKKKKDMNGSRRARKQVVRIKIAKEILAKDGAPVTPSTVRTTIQGLQQKHQLLQNRISKKKERKIMKQVLRKQKAAEIQKVQMDVDASPSKSSPSKTFGVVPRKALSTDVEMS